MVITDILSHSRNFDLFFRITNVSTLPQNVSMNLIQSSGNQLVKQTYLPSINNIHWRISRKCIQLCLLCWTEFFLNSSDYRHNGHSTRRLNQFYSRHPRFQANEFHIKIDVKNDRHLYRNWVAVNIEYPRNKQKTSVEYVY